MASAKHKDGRSRQSDSRVRYKMGLGRTAKATMSREILAAGLTAAAAAIAASPKSRRAIREAGVDAADSAAQAATSMMTNASKLGSLIAEAVAEAAQRVLSNSSGSITKQLSNQDARQLRGEGIGELLSLTEFEAKLSSIVDDESTEWAFSELLGVLEAAEHIGVARSTLDHWRRSGKVLAFSKGLRNFIFPMEQFDGSKPLPGLDEVRHHFSSDEDAWEWLITADKILGDRKPIDLLKDRRVDEVVRAAEGALDFA